MEASNNYRPDGDWMIYVFAALIIIVFSFFTFGCTTQRKAVSYMNNHAFQGAQYCASAFPVRDSVIYKEGQTKVVSHIDTIQGKVIGCPNYFDQPTKTIYVKCPPSTRRTDTIYRTDTIMSIRENTAQISALTIERDKYSTELKQAENGRSKWREWFLISWGVVAFVFAGITLLKLKII
ncbi:MAG: hypothetical protein EPN37_07270 [Chitinophagaceae bacterium]|nr:MAG: hypothetical protein EPN37_07270 [Chitinophagaceae bacterium]